MATRKAGTLGFSISSATCSRYAAAGVSASEKWMAHGPVCCAEFEAGSTGCVAYQSFAALLVPTVKLTGWCGDPPAKSADERLKTPMVKTAEEELVCAFAGLEQTMAGQEGWIHTAMRCSVSSLTPWFVRRCPSAFGNGGENSLRARRYRAGRSPRRLRQRRGTWGWRRVKYPRCEWLLQSIAAADAERTRRAPRQLPVER